MQKVDGYVTETAAPRDQTYEGIDARELPPPQPLQGTLERLVELEDSEGLVQLNDRRPQHLYPKLEERGYEYETLEVAEGVVTVIWKD